MKTTLCLLFKSGVTLKFRVTDWKVTFTGETLTGLTWHNTGRQKLVHADLREIASVWEER